MYKYEVGILHIDYDEFDPETYRAVTISLDSKEEMRFASGDFVKDWNNATAFMDENVGIKMESSSVGHFMQDGASYQFIYEDE